MGHDTVEVLKELALQTDEIEKLLEKKIIASSQKGREKR